MKVKINNCHGGNVRASFETTVPDYNPDIEHGVRYVPSVLDPLLVKRVTHADGRKSVTIQSDVHVLLYDKQLESKVGTDALSQYVRGMYNDAGVPLPKNANFNEIAKGIKSRYIQSPSELRSWIDSLGEDMRSQFTAYMENAVNTQRAEEQPSNSGANGNN